MIPRDRYRPSSLGIMLIGATLAFYIVKPPASSASASPHFVPLSAVPLTYSVYPFDTMLDASPSKDVI